MKIVVESEEDFQKWMAEQETVAKALQPELGETASNPAEDLDLEDEEPSVMTTEKMSETGTEIPAITNDSIQKN